MASPIVLVNQNGNRRFCIDFRRLNGLTIGDTYPMLRSKYLFNTLGDKNRFFTTMDAVKGYYQLIAQPARQAR